MISIKYAIKGKKEQINYIQQCKFSDSGIYYCTDCYNIEIHNNADFNLM